MGQTRSASLHRVYKTPWQGDPRVNIQNSKVRQVLQAIERLEVTNDLKAQSEPVPIALPIKDFSGKFMVRIPPEVHRMLAIQATESGVSLNRLVSSKLH